MTKNQVMANVQYEEALHEALGDDEFFPEWVSKVLDFLYLGGEVEALDRNIIKENNFTHVINCAVTDCPTGAEYYGDGIKYLGFKADDREGYDILQHFQETYDAIEDARTSGGKVLLHCIMGINRSGALATAYVMLHKNMDVISAAKFVKAARGCILTNQSFQKQLIQFACEKNLLPEKTS